MIMRRILTTDGDDWQTLRLECGHEVGPIAASKPPKKRERCPHCEFIAAFRESSNEHRFFYNHLVQQLQHVPREHRVLTLMEWIKHFKTFARFMRLSGWDHGLFDKGMLLTQRPTTYPLAAFLRKE